MTPKDNGQPAVAITGLSCRFPGEGDSLNSFWTSICEGQYAFWSGSGKKRHGSVTKHGHFIKEDVSRFDANFFSIPRAEANAMDPQHRIMLEVAYEALESAGYPAESLAGTRTGVFMGHFTGDYKELVLRDADAMPPYATTGLNKTSLANRISWTFDLRGPSFSLDTACSSSLVALHLACQSLRTGESDMAIVGGSNLLLNPEMFIAFSGQGFLSADGKCKSFDASGDGYGRGEGVAVVVLKRVDDAIAAKDPLRTIIRATGSNQDGHTKSLTLPRAEAQQALIEEVYSMAGLDFSQTGYVEAHGTGTQAGDKEETLALSRTIAHGRSSVDELVIGSVKANIGHLEAASGLAGVVKSVLMLENGIIPPQISFKKPNPSIKFDEWHLKVPTEAAPWPKEGLRRVSINSFGYGGSNAHAILDDAYHYLRSRGLEGQHNTNVMTEATGDTRSEQDYDQVDTPRVFMMTAQDRDGLSRVRKSWASWLRKKAETMEDDEEDLGAFLSDLSHTANSRRSRLQWKTFAVGSSLEELAESMVEPTLEAMSSSAPHLAFVFTGQGAQWATMGTRLMRFPEYRSSIEAADQFLKKHLKCPWSIQTELARGKATTRLGQALYSQTLCTVLQVALVDLLRAWGAVPEAVVGHSSGEIAAAYCAGFLSRQDAWKIAYCRGMAAARMKEEALELDGAMMAVGASSEQCATLIRDTCPGKVDIACVNSPSSVTLSGDAASIDTLQDSLKEANIFSRKLLVDTAYHSKHMRLVASDYRDSIADLQPLSGGQGDCRMHSSVTASQIQAADLGPDYWVQNLVSPVQFAAAVEDLVLPSATGDSINLFVEIGPHNALQGPVTQTLQSLGPQVKPYLSAMVRNKDQVDTILRLVGSLAVYGAPVYLNRVNRTSQSLHKTLIDLPSYPWNHGQQYWAESRLTRAYKQREHSTKSLLGAPVPPSSDTDRTWRGFLRRGEEEWVADHKIQGSVLYPGAGFLVMAIEAAVQSADKTREIKDVHLRNVEFLSAMLFTEDRELEHTITLRSASSTSADADSQWLEFVICSSPDGKILSRNCHGEIRLDFQDQDRTSHGALPQVQSRYAEVLQSCKATQESDDFYHDLDSLGLTYGPAFANLTEISSGGGKSCGNLKIPDVGLKSPTRPHIIHPTTLDATFHLAFAAANSRRDSKLTVPMVPRALDQMHVSVNIPYEAHTNLTAFSNAAISRSKGELKADITVLESSEAQHAALEITGLRCVEIAQASASREDAALPRKLCSKLVWGPAADLLTRSEMEHIVAETDVPAPAPGSMNTPVALPSRGTLAPLRKYLEMIYHNSPDMRILEIVDQESSLVKELDLPSDMIRDVNFTLVCADDAAKLQVQEASALVEGVTVNTLRSMQESFADQSSDAKVRVVICRARAETRARIMQDAESLTREVDQLCVVESPRQTPVSENLLLSNGFTIRYHFAGMSDSDHGILIASLGTSATNGHIKDSRQVILICPDHMPDNGERLAVQLEKRLSDAGCDATRHCWGADDVSQLQDKDCISLLELQSSLLERLQEKDFYSLQSLLLGCKSLLWLNALRGARSSLINGLARVVRNEVPGLRLRTLHLPSVSSSVSERLCDFIFRTWESRTSDNEFSVQNDIVHVSRVVEDVDLNANFVHSDTPKLDQVALQSCGQPLQLKIRHDDQGYFVSSPVETMSIETDEVEIRVQAVSVSSHTFAGNANADLNSPPLFTASGSIVKIGSSVTQFQPGDAVVIFGQGTPQTIHRCKASVCAPISDGFTLEQAADAQGVYAAAWYGLVQVARISECQSILIHDAATGLGLAAIKIAQHYGLDVYSVIDSKEEGALLRDVCNIPRQHIFDYMEVMTSQDLIRETTGGHGVDVVFYTPGHGAVLQTCLAPFGTILEVGLNESPAAFQRDIPRGATFSSFCLSSIATQRPKLMAEIVRGVTALHEKNILSPLNLATVFQVSELQDAVHHVQDGGGAILTFKDEDSIPVARARPTIQPLSGEACYVLAGGLGGLGRCLAMMLAQNGAKKLCFLSRSGTSSTAAQELTRDLSRLGLQVDCIQCDVSDAEALATSLQTCSEKLGPVRGVIQCAMVLRDTLFSNMAYSDWEQSTLPKVQGSMNLHNALPDVDFFIMLSSFAGIFGNRGQSNYAAGCAFQDALAIQRQEEGKVGTSLDVGLMRDVGILAETGMTEGLKDWEEPYGVRESELLDLVMLAIADRLPAQVLTGLATGGSALLARIPMPFYLADAKFSIMAQMDMAEAANRAAATTNGTTEKQKESIRALVLGSEDAGEAASHIAAALVSRVAKLLELPEHDVDKARALHSYGLDSLAAIEVVDWALKELDARINVFDVMVAEPITATATKIAKASSLVAKKKE